MRADDDRALITRTDQPEGFDEIEKASLNVHVFSAMKRDQEVAMWIDVSFLSTLELSIFG